MDIQLNPSLMATLQAAPEEIIVDDAMVTFSFRITAEAKRKFQGVCQASGKCPSNVLRTWIETAVREFNSCDG